MDKPTDINSLYESRKPIWEALSRLYLDQELDEKDYNNITETLKASLLRLEDLKKIDLYEVFPTFYKNLISPVGEWAGFAEAWLYKECWKNHQNSHNQGFRISASIKNTFWPWMRKEAWEEIEKRFNEENID